MTDIATASKTVTLSSLESLDNFQKVSVKNKVVKLKDNVEVRERMKQVLEGTKDLTQWSTALRTYLSSGQRTHFPLGKQGCLQTRAYPGIARVQIIAKVANYNAVWACSIQAK